MHEQYECVYDCECVDVCVRGRETEYDSMKERETVMEKMEKVKGRTGESD